MVIDPCLAHSQRWKADFQCVINSFQKKKNGMKMPIQYIRRVAKKICTCDLDDDDTLEDDVNQQKICEEAIREIATLKSFFTNLTPEEKTKLGNGQPILLKMLDSLSPKMTGMLLFLNIIHDALHGIYDRLKQVDKSTEWCEETIQLPLPDDYAGLLIGKGGQLIKDLSKTYKCQIHVKGVDVNNPKNLAWANEVSVSLRWKKEHEEKIPTLKAHLMAQAATICKKRREQHEEYMYRAALPSWSDACPDRHADGTCICLYHPGYPIPLSNGEKNKHGFPPEYQYQWSCCGEPMSLEALQALHDEDMEVEGTYSSHASTGCTRGKQWHGRPPAGHKDAAAHQSRHKNSEKLLEDEDVTSGDRRSPTLFDLISRPIDVPYL